MANASKGSVRLKVLYGEGDSDVLVPNTAALKNAGHEVVTAEGRKAMEAAMKQGQFDLILLGGSMSRNDRHHLPYMVKKISHAMKVVVMHTDGERHPYVDGNIDTGQDMDHLLAKINEVFAGVAAPAKTKAAAAGK